MKKVAVVILNYNGFHFIEKFLPELLKHTPDYAEIIIADNKSSDDSATNIQRAFPNIRFIQLSENYGFAEGYNQVLRHVDAEYFALINSDIEVTSNWLGPLVQFLDSHPTYAAVQPKILSYNNKEFFEYAGAAGGFIDILGYPYCRGRIFDSIEKDEGQYDTLIDVHWCSGACFVIRSNDFKAHEFDGDFFAHMEEIDLCYRLIRSGRKLACLPQSYVYHVGGGTLHHSSPFKTYLNFRNSLLLILKNEGFIKLLWMLPVRFLLDLLAGLVMWRRHSYHHFLQVGKAQLAFIKMTGKSVKKRERTKHSSLRSSQTPVIFSYYILGKKKYSRL